MSLRILNSSLQRPAHLAAQCGSLRCLRLIFDKERELAEKKEGGGWDPLELELDLEDGDGQTVLDHAVENNYRKMARFIIVSNASLDSSDDDEVGEEMRKNSKDVNALYLACAFGTPRQLATLLGALKQRDRAADSDSDCHRHHLDRKWMEYSRDRRGRTPFHCAAAAGRTAHLDMLLRYLREHFAGDEWPADDDGRTPFDVAVDARDVWACKIIIDYLSGWVRNRSDVDPVVAFGRDAVSSPGAGAGTGVPRRVPRPFKDGANLLYYSMFVKSLRCCKMVVEAGRRSDWDELGSVLKPSNFKMSVLHVAVRKGDMSFLVFFLDHLVSDEWVLHKIELKKKTVNLSNKRTSSTAGTGRRCRRC